MARIAGFLTGSAAAIALILLVIGVPRLGEPEARVVEPEAPSAAPAASTTPEPAADPEPATASEPVAAEAPRPDPLTTSVPEPDPTPAHWHAFWSPFGSRIAADGFVRRLESVTGFDFRVVKVDNGVYEVAFAYSDEAERDAMLSTIAAATGLELPDS